MIRTYTLAVAVGTLALAAVAADPEPFLVDTFDNLDNWKPLSFPKIKKHSTYRIVQEKDGKALEAASTASASGLLLKKEFNVTHHPRVSWRWKIHHVFKKGDATKKAGDDYPIRLYVIFKYDPAKASFGTRMKYGVAKRLHGEYPPHSSLTYIWANRKHKTRIITSPYSSRAKMIVLQAGDNDANTWKAESVNILKDYEAAFGEAPPQIASLAIMSDADNTEESTVAHVDDIRIHK